MDYDQLIEKITREILKQVKEKQDQEAPVMDKVLIYASSDDTHLPAVMEALGSSVQPVLMGDADENETFSRRILPRLSCSQMADLSQGRGADSFTGRVLGDLLSGTSVEVFSYEYQEYRETAPDALFSLYESHRKTLESFGLFAFEEKKPESVKLKKQLVTEKDIMGALNTGAREIKVGLRATVTPLAKDAARNHGINIIPSV